MKTTIVTGMLGAGKTTFISNYLDNSKGRTVVLVNDFGDFGVDGEVLSRAGLETIELPSGCICCTLKFDLINTLQRILKELRPDHLMIEPSGIASPSGVMEALSALGITSYAVITVLDASEFLDIYLSGMYGAFFEDQIRNADLILINKTDLADAETVKRIESIVDEINPSAILIPTTRAIIHAEELPQSEHTEIHSNTSEHKIPFETITVKIPHTVEFKAFSMSFESLNKKELGNIIRAKALVETDQGPFRFDLSSGRVEITLFDAPVENGRVLIIGERLSEDLLLEHFGLT